MYEHVLTHGKSLLLSFPTGGLWTARCQAPLQPSVIEGGGFL